MNDLEHLEHVLEYGGEPVLWGVPEDAVITPGDGPNIWDGLTISHWSDDA